MWRKESISGKEAEVFTPASGKTGQAVIYLHAYGQERLSEQGAFTQLFEEHRLSVVAPRGGVCWWLDVVSPQFDPQRTPMEYLRTEVLCWIEQEWGIVPPKIGLLGISMGGQGALNLAYRHARQFPVVAAISPAIDFHRLYGQGYGLEEMFADAEAARQQTVTLHLHPLNWPRFQFFACDPQDPTWYEGCERLASKLDSSGILHERDLQTSHGGHNWDYFTRMAEKGVEFIKRGLDRA